MITDYRTVKITNEDASERLPVIFLNTDDVRGRIVQFELWNDGNAVNGSGMSAKFYILSQGTSYHQDMILLSGTETATWQAALYMDDIAPGEHTAEIRVTDTDGTIVATRPFTAIVERGVIGSSSGGGSMDTDDPLDIVHGGTGMTTSPVIIVDLASSSSTNVLQSNPTPGVTGTLPIAHGGTGATTAAGAPWLQKSGGTLTGNTTISGAYELVKATDLDVGDGATEDTWGNARIVLRDRDDVTIGQIAGRMNTNGRAGIILGANTPNGTNYITLFVGENGAQSVIVSNADAWRSALGVIASTGGTYTGKVTMSAKDVDLKASDYTIGTTPTDNTNSDSRLVMRDSAGTSNAVIGTRYLTDGRVGLDVYAQRNVNGLKFNSLDLYIDDSGKPSVELSAKDAWRTALGVGAYGSRTGLASQMTLTQTAANVSYNTFSGVNCSAYSGGIKVASAGVYEVWGQIYTNEGFIDQDLVHCALYADSNTIIDVAQRMNGTTYQTILAGPAIIELTAGAIVYLRAYNQTAARGKIGNRTGYGLYVRRIA